MRWCRSLTAKGLFAATVLPILLFLPTSAPAAQLKQETVGEWNTYIAATQAAMERRGSGQMPFLWLDSIPDGSRRARNGEVLVAPFDEHTPRHVSGGLVHHWIGATFIPGARMSDTMGVVRDYPRYKEFYKPSVIASNMDPDQPATAHDDDRFVIRLRNESAVSKTALDTAYSASYVHLDPLRCYGIARTTRIQEIVHYGDPKQRMLPPDEGNGYIWRLYTITRFQERDGGVYVEAEAVALSRDIPVAARWFVDPIVRRISRDALDTSLTQTKQAVHIEVIAESNVGKQDAAGGSTPGANSVPAHK